MCVYEVCVRVCVCACPFLCTYYALIIEYIIDNFIINCTRVAVCIFCELLIYLWKLFLARFELSVFNCILR